MAWRIIEGNQALAIGAKLCRPKVIASYPITPSTHVPETISEFVADGELKADFINVESEQSAISACIGAQATGVRTFTATASQGLALMHEMLYIASGMRLPIVIGCANRALSAPINIWCDHSDTMAERDAGWLQFYAENNQEALDLVLQAYKIAENKEVLLPGMVAIDAYTLTHTFERVDVPSQAEVDRFLPPYKPLYAFLDPEKPITQGSFGTPEHYMEFKYSQQKAMEASKEIIDQVFKEFDGKFKRRYHKIEKYKADDAEILLLTMGSMSGTAKDAVDRLREKGIKVGLAKFTVFRPFPAKELIEIAKRPKVLAVVDRNISLGHKGALFSDATSALASMERRPLTVNFIIGLGGRDISPQNFYEIVEKSEKILKKGKVEKELEWIGVKKEMIP
ncbi:MAG TPA: pyruvate ferredoxin oxidoreductase [Thermoplasmata archaeon]|nr:pyruvate ferredoxin oxidoreductase [Thermoplasmata archaeon]